MSEVNDLTVSFVTNENQLARIEALAESEDRSRSSMMRLLIEKGIDAMKNTPVQIKPRDLSPVGVMPLVCANCEAVFGVINADAWREARESGEFHFCPKCMELPESELVENLEAKTVLEVA